MRCLALLMILLGGSLRADEPHLEFVERLRANRLADVAVEYLDELAKNPPPDIAKRLPYERAKSLAVLAEQYDDDTQRDERLTQARTALEAYLQISTDQRSRAEGRFELAQLLVKQGRFRVGAARRLENRAVRQDGLAKARQSFDLAETALRTVGIELNQARDMSWTRLKVNINDIKFETALVTMYRALTYSERNAEKIAKRGEELHAARKQFLALAELDANDPLCWRALVEVGRCWMELDSAADAYRVFSIITRSGNLAPPESQRIARYYELLLSDRTTKSGSPDVIRGCEDWLLRFASALKTAEGQGVRFLLASHLMQQAQLDITAGTNGRVANVGLAARTQLIRAESLLKPLTGGNGEFSQKAANLRAEVLALLIAERAALGVRQLQNFEECYLSAQVDAFQISKMTGNNETSAKRKAHLLRAIQALQYGLQLANTRDDPKEVFNARLMLSYLFQVNGDPYSAAVLGEHIARTAAPNPRGAKAAAYALSAYATILRDSRLCNAPPAEIAADVRRLRDLAEFVERIWPAESDTDAARFQLGNLFYDDRQYSDAIDMYSRIGAGFPALAYARYRQGAAAQLAQHPQYNLDSDTKNKLLLRTIADLERVSDPTIGSSSDTVLATYQARLQLGQLLLLHDQTGETCDRIEKLGSQLKSLLNELLEKGDPAFVQLEVECERTRLSGLWGKAMAAIKRGQPEAAHRMLEPQLGEIAKFTSSWGKSAYLAEPWFQGFLQVQRDIVLLDIRANIGAGQSAALLPAINSLKELAGTDHQRFAYDLLMRLVLDLRNELESLRNSSITPKTQVAEKGLIALLDELSRPKDLSVEVRIFLAQGYSAVKQHNRAAQLLETINDPNPDDDSAVKSYRYAQLLLAKEHRLGSDYVQAKAVLRRIMGTQQQKAWGFDNFDVRREAIALLEDEGQFAGAVQMAIQMQNKLLESAREYENKAAVLKKMRSSNGDSESANALEQDLQRLAPLRDRYYEFYYCEARAIARHAQINNDAKSGEVLARLATRLVKLEQGLADMGGVASRARLAELVNDHATLKEKYTVAGGKTLLPKGDGR